VTRKKTLFPEGINRLKSLGCLPVWSRGYPEKLRNRFCVDDHKTFLAHKCKIALPLSVLSIRQTAGGRRIPSLFHAMKKIPPQRDLLFLRFFVVPFL